MTEDEWLACEKPAKMLRHLRRLAGRGVELRSWIGRSSHGALSRKERLLLSACCYRVSPLLAHEPQAVSNLIEFAQGFAEQAVTDQDYIRVREWFCQTQLSKQAVRLLRALTTPYPDAVGQFRQIAAHHSRALTPRKSDKRSAYSAALKIEAAVQCEFIRDIFGNPFQQMMFTPAWRSSQAVDLAATMYESNSLDRMSKLADALQQAGCDDANILHHCRASRSHVRGCWVVDLILARE